MAAAMASVFYEQKFNRLFPISFLFIEHVAANLQAVAKKEEHSEQDVIDQVYTSIRIICKIENPSEEHLDYALTRLSKLAEEHEANQSQTPRPSKKVGFATSYMDWAAALDPQDACLVAAGFDYSQAEKLYCDVDREDVLKITEARMRYEWENIKIAYESSVYAFGGSYDGDDSRAKGKITEYDLNKGDPEGMAALAKVL